jgi:putative AdoMet-dependent methyltransferase
MNDSRVKLFDRWASGYDEMLAEQENLFPFDGYERVLDAIVTEAGAAPGMAALDLGIGTGNLAARMITAGFTVVGIDFSAPMLVKACGKLPDLLPVQATLDAPLPLRTSFDCIVSSYVLHEFPLPDKIALLRRLAEAHLRMDGTILVGDISFPSARHRARARERLAPAWDEDEFYWAADETSEALQQSGLTMTYRQLSSCAGLYAVRAEM